MFPQRRLVEQAAFPAQRHRRVFHFAFRLARPTGLHATKGYRSANARAFSSG